MSNNFPLTDVDLTALAYKCALGGQGYEEFLMALQMRFSTDFLCLWQFEQHSRQTLGTAIGNPGLTTETVQSFKQKMAQLAIGPRGAEIAIGEVLSLTAQDGAPLCPQEIAAMVLLKRDASFSLFAALTRRNGPAFSQRERDRIARILADFTCALDLASRTRRFHFGALAVDILNHLRVGVVILKADGTLLGANRSAERALIARGAREAHFSGLLSLTAQQRKKLVTMAQQIREHPREPVLFDLRVDAETEKRVLGVSLSDIHGQDRGPLALFVLPTDIGAAPLEMLSRNAALTGREKDVAGALLQGMPVPQIAKHLSISYETTRTHVKSILSKSRCSGQKELIMTYIPAIAALDWTALSAHFSDETEPECDGDAPASRQHQKSQDPG